MLGVRSNAAPLLQDENAFSSLGPQRMNKENGEGVLVGRGARAFGAALSGGKAGVQPLGAVPRKALGNITNATSSKSQQQLGGDGPDKSGSGKEGVRRAFAELTNNAGAAAGPNSSGKGGFGGGAAKPQPLQQLQPAPLGSRSVHTAPRDFPSAGKAPSKAELYALGGVERLAGKGWAQLEAERRQREVAGVQQRVKAALGSTSALRPSLAFMIQVGKWGTGVSPPRARRWYHRWLVARVAQSWSATWTARRQGIHQTGLPFPVWRCSCCSRRRLTRPLTMTTSSSLRRRPRRRRCGAACLLHPWRQGPQQVGVGGVIMGWGVGRLCAGRCKALGGPQGVHPSIDGWGVDGSLRDAAELREAAACMVASRCPPHVHATDAMLGYGCSGHSATVRSVLPPCGQ